MNDFVTRGSKTLTQIDRSSTWDNRNGGTTTDTWTSNTGTTSNVCPNDLQAEAITLIGQGWSTQINQNKTGPRWTLVATYPADLITDPNQTRIPDIQWDIEPYEIEQNILEAEDIPFIANLSTTTKALIENARKYPAGAAPLTTPAEISQFPSAFVAYALMTAGVESRELFSISLKRTLIIPKWIPPNWLLNHNNQVLGYNFLVNNYLVPSWVAASLPFGSSTTQTDFNGLNYFYGYREYAPERHNIGGNKVEWKQLWKYNKWSVRPNGLYVV